MQHLIIAVTCSSTYEVHHNKMQDNAGKDEVSKCSLGADAELALVSGVALDTQTNCVEGEML